MVAAMIEFAVVLVLNKLQQHAKCDNLTKAEKKATSLKPLAKGNDVPGWVGEHSRMRYFPDNNIPHKCWAVVNLSTDNVDIAALTVSLSLYFFFNFVYWVQYLLF